MKTDRLTIQRRKHLKDDFKKKNVMFFLYFFIWFAIVITTAVLSSMFLKLRFYGFSIMFAEYCICSGVTYLIEKKTNFFNKKSRKNKKK
jgi:hypothetical protein